MALDPKAAGGPSPALVFDTLIAYQRTAALRAAIELDLFRAIGEGPGDVPSIAQRCAASERGIRILCDFLTINGLLSKTGGGVRAHADQRPVPRPALAGVRRLDGALPRQPDDPASRSSSSPTSCAAAAPCCPARAASSRRTRSGSSSRTAWRR